jgi:hypothetical protein
VAELLRASQEGRNSMKLDNYLRMGGGGKFCLKKTIIY